VSLVAILDADKEGFLRSEISLIQTIGRAARHVSGQVIMYADEITDSMRRAIDETNRRRAKQVEYNTAHGITPQSVRKAIRDLLVAEVAEATPVYMAGDGLVGRDRDAILAELERDMRLAAQELRFEEAARLRDHIQTLRQERGENPTNLLGTRAARTAKPRRRRRRA